MRESDRDYFMRRAQEEREAAIRAASEAARRSHVQLAERYAKAALALEAAGDRDEDGVNWAVVSRVSIDAERSTDSAPTVTDAEDD